MLLVDLSDESMSVFYSFFSQVFTNFVLGAYWVLQIGHWLLSSNW